MFGIDDAIAGVGSAIGGAFSYFGQRDANRTNRDIANQANAQTAYQAQLNRDWQERMSNTSFQRGVADMKAAGINPMLAFSKGGASTPGGSAATATTGAPQQSTTAGVPAAVTSALQLHLNAANLENIRAQTAKTVADAEAVIASTPKKKFEGAVYTDVGKGYSSAKQIIDSILHHDSTSDLNARLSAARKRFGRAS